MRGQPYACNHYHRNSLRMNDGNQHKILRHSACKRREPFYLYSWVFFLVCVFFSRKQELQEEYPFLFKKASRTEESGRFPREEDLVEEYFFSL